MATFPDVGVHELYGSTEAGIVTNLRPVDQHRKPGSVGHPWFLTELRVVDDDGQPVAAGEPGELFSRSPYLMNGYHDDPDATAACTTDDGFLTCGDIVVRDDEGYVHIVDRKKDLIISGGVNVYPREVEDVLVTHAGRRRGRGRRRARREVGRAGGRPTSCCARATAGRRPPDGARRALPGPARGLQGAPRRTRHAGAAAQRGRQDPQARAENAMRLP